MHEVYCKAMQIFHFCKPALRPLIISKEVSPTIYF